MKLKNRLYLGLGSLIIIMLVVAINAIYQLNILNKHMETIVHERYQTTKLAVTIRYEVGNIGRNLSGLLLVESKVDQILYMGHIEASAYKVSQALIDLKGISTEQDLSEIRKLEIIYNDYLHNAEEVIALIDQDQEKAKQVLLAKSNTLHTQLIEQISKINSIQESQMEKALIDSQETVEKGLGIVLFLIFFAFILGIYITVWLVRTITGNLRELITAMKSLAYHQDKKFLPRLEVKNNDELGEITEAFNTMASDLEQHARQDQESAQAIQDQYWLKSKLAEVTALSQGIQDTESFARLVINWLCTSLKASHGTFYVVEDPSGSRQLVSKAFYGSKHTKPGTLVIEPGEGLVGQCMMDNKIICLDNIPDNYIHITSGLGSTPPKQITIIPIEYEWKVIAVIEIASLGQLSSLDLELLKQVSWNIGVVLNRISDHMQVQKLLNEAQILTEELQTQSEELQVQKEELSVFNEKLEEQFKDSEKKTMELLEAKAALEEHARQLASSSQYKSEFLSNMSHELRTPLNSLIILGKLLVENKESNLTPKQMEYIETILSSGQDLLALINDILDLSKIEAGKMQLKFEETSLEKLKEELARQFAPIAQHKGLEFNVEMESNLPSSIHTDHAHVKQILQNLLSNAMKFTHEGSVEFKIFKKHDIFSELMHTEPSEYHSALFGFSISDTGIGIPEDKKELIFAAFQQGDGTTSRKYGGTGLGLSICKELASLLGGFIKLDSIEGQGSTFTLYIPEKNPDKKIETHNLFTSHETYEFCNSQTHFPYDEEPSVPDTLYLLKGKKILVVDDDMRNLFAITAALEDQQLEVVVAENGLKALEKLEEHPEIDLVLMDIMMPEMDGYETIQTIREIPEYAGIPIIALTAKAMKTDREKCLQYGASDYISKPVEIKQLLSVIQVWLYR